MSSKRAAQPSPNGCGSKTGIPKWVPLVSGNMVATTCGLPLLVNFEPHPNERASGICRRFVGTDWSEPIGRNRFVTQWPSQILGETLLDQGLRFWEGADFRGTWVTCRPGSHLASPVYGVFLVGRTREKNPPGDPQKPNPGSFFF